MTPHAPPEQEPYLTTKELAARWRRSPNALRIMRHRRQGPRSYRFGREVRWPLAEIEAYEAAAREADSRWNTDLDPTKRKAESHRPKRPARRRSAAKPSPGSEQSAA